MAITAAQANATRNSRATQSARRTIAIAMIVWATARARESKSGAGCSNAPSSPPSLLDVSPWRCIGDQLLVVPTYSFSAAQATSHNSLHVDGRQLPTLAARPVSLGSQLTHIDLIIVMVFRGRSEVRSSNGIFGIAPWKR